MSWLLIAALDALIVGAFCAAVWAFARRPPTEHEQLEQHFEHQLLHDDLTKLPNRTLFRDRLPRAAPRSGRPPPAGARPRGAPAAASPARSCRSTSTASPSSTTASAPPPATSCCARPAPGSTP